MFWLYFCNCKFTQTEKNWAKNISVCSRG